MPKEYNIPALAEDKLQIENLRNIAPVYKQISDRKILRMALTDGLTSITEKAKKL